MKLLKNTIYLWLCSFFLCLPVLVAGSQDRLVLPDQARAFDMVKERTKNFLTGGSENGYYQRLAVATLDDWTSQYMSKEPVDLEWNEDNWNVFNEELAQRASEVRKLTIAHDNSASRYFGNTHLEDRITEELRSILTFFNPETERPGNWYYWLMPLPRELGIIGLLAEDFLPRELFSSLIRSLRFELSDNMILTGANAVWEAKNHFYLALLDHDIKRLEKSARHAFSEIRLGIGEAIREDFAYMFHGLLPYAGLYGAGFVETISDFIYYLEGSPWATSPLHREIIVNLLLEHTRWFISGDKIDSHILGRGYEMGDRGWSSIFKSVLIMSQTQSPRKEELEKTAKAMMDKKVDISIEIAEICDKLDSVSGELPMGFRYWASAEIGVFNQPGYHVGFRQYSDRVLDYEYLTGLGKEGWNLAFGFTNILRTDGTGSWYADDGSLLENIDMEHLPGTTSRIGGNPVNPPVTDPSVGVTGYSLNRGTAAFAGGAGWKNAGVAGFQLIPTYGGFEAQKSLHFFDKGYWALGSDIQSTSDSMEILDKPVHTTVIQWVCDNENPNIVVNDAFIGQIQNNITHLSDVNWMWFEKVGLIFPKPQNVVLRKVGRIITVWIDHGVAPELDRYAFAVLPHSSRKDTHLFYSDRTVWPLRFDSRLHAVRDRENLCTGMVFFQPDTCLNLTSQSPSIVYWKGDHREGIFTVQDPLHSGNNLRFTAPLTQPVTRPDPAVRVTKIGSRPTSLDVAAYAGRIYRLGYGALGQLAHGRFREDLTSYDEFYVKADSDSSRTILTVFIPEKAMITDYQLTIHGQKSHKLYELSEKDVIDRPSNGVVRYEWKRDPAEGPGGVFQPHMKQDHGRFRIYLRTPLVTVVDYFTVPEFE